MPNKNNKVIFTKVEIIELLLILFINIINGIVTSSETSNVMDSLLVTISDTSRMAAYISLTHFPILGLLFTILHAAIIEPLVLIIAIPVLIVNIIKTVKNIKSKRDNLNIVNIILHEKEYNKINSVIIRVIIIANVFGIIALAYKSEIFKSALDQYGLTGTYGILSILMLMIPIIALIAMLTISSLSYDFLIIEISFQVFYMISLFIAVEVINIPSILAEVIYIKIYIDILKLDFKQLGSCF